MVCNMFPVYGIRDILFKLFHRFKRRTDVGAHFLFADAGVSAWRGVFVAACDGLERHLVFRCRGGACGGCLFRRLYAFEEEEIPLLKNGRRVSLFPVGKKRQLNKSLRICEICLTASDIAYGSYICLTAS